MDLMGSTWMGDPLLNMVAISFLVTFGTVSRVYIIYFFGSKQVRLVTACNNHSRRVGYPRFGHFPICNQA